MTGCGRAALAGLAISALFTLAEAVPPAKPAITTSLTWTHIEPQDRCRPETDNRPTKQIELRTDQIAIRQYVRKDDGSLVWLCVVSARTPERVIRQGRFVAESFFAWKDLAVFTEYRGPALTRVYRIAKGQVRYADVAGPAASPSANTRWLAENTGAISNAYLFFDQSGRQQGIYVLPVATGRGLPKTMTFWPDGDFLEWHGEGLQAERLCSGRRLWTGSRRNGVSAKPVIRCTVARHNGWSEIRLTPDHAVKGGLLFVHGGPATAGFTLNTQQHLLAFADAGYDVVAVNYTDAYPVPTGAAAARQFRSAQNEVQEAYASLAARTRKTPTVLAESFGFLLLEEILKRPEPLQILAMSPVTSGQGFLNMEKQRGLSIGLPHATWPLHKDLFLTAPDIAALLCHRKAPTKLNVFASKGDAIFNAGGAAFLAAVEKCRGVALTRSEATGSDHASPALYLNLLAAIAGMKAFHAYADDPALHFASEP